MTIGIIGGVTGAATLSYTPTSNAKVIVNYTVSSSGAVTINGTAIAAAGTSSTIVSGSVITYVGAGQTLALVVGAGATAAISTIEES